jgi:hypothetical protein
MPKTKQSKASEAQPASFSRLALARQKTTANHLRSANTNTAYSGHIKRGREWLAEWVTSLKDATSGPELPSEFKSGVRDTAYYASALDDIPTRSSPDALSLFITYKCLDQNCKMSTADQVRAAFKALWNDS